MAFSDRFRGPRRGGLGRFEERSSHRGAQTTLVLLLLACACLITLDAREDSPLEPVRAGVGEVFGPVETATASVVRPFAAIPEWFQTQKSLRADVADLEADNAALRREVATADLDRNRLTEYDGLARAAADTGYALVPAHVVAMGPSQSFSRTVTIDAGSDAGLTADMTVLNDDGLVGRVIRVNRTTATVLLLLDADSVVGGRIGRSMEVGFLSGRGQLGQDGNLDLELVDSSAVPAADDVVVTWGSKDGVPYVAGVPIGRVTHVYASPRETSQRAVIAPFVDFSALDLVGVVVPADTVSDRQLVQAEAGR